MNNLETVTETSTPVKTEVKQPDKKKAVPKVEKPKKEASAPKVEKPTKKAPSPVQGHGSFPLTAKIKLVTKENPHRQGTNLHKYFKKYKDGMTVQQALDAGIVWPNLRYLKSLGHIKIG